jgi:hypothetical protein
MGKTHVRQWKQLNLIEKEMHLLLERSTISIESKLLYKAILNTYGLTEFSYGEQPPIPTLKSSGAFNQRFSDPF